MGMVVSYSIQGDAIENNLEVSWSLFLTPWDMYLQPNIYRNIKPTVFTGIIIPIAAGWSVFIGRFCFTVVQSEGSVQADILTYKMFISESNAGIVI